MEKELEQRIFLEKDYNDKNEMEQKIKEYIYQLYEKNILMQQLQENFIKVKTF